MKIERVDVSKKYVDDIKRVLEILQPIMSNIRVQGKDINSIKEILLFKDKKKLWKHVQKDKYNEIRVTVDEWYTERMDIPFAKRGYLFLTTSDPKSYLCEHLIIEEVIHALTEIKHDDEIFYDFIDLVDKKVGFHVPRVALKFWNHSKAVVEHYYTFTLITKYAPKRIVGKLNTDLTKKFRQMSNHIRSTNYNPIIIAFYLPDFALGNVFDITFNEQFVEDYHNEYEQIRKTLLRLPIIKLQNEGHLLIKEICETQLNMCLDELKNKSPRFLSDSRARTLISL
jgi:hypothetical protein